MTMHPGEARLNDYLDGELDDRAAAETSRHLDACGVCRDEVERLGRVLTAAATLGDEVAPRHDLWPGIDARIDSAASVELDDWRDRSRGGIWGRRHQLAVAATLLVLAASAGTLVLVREAGRSAATAVAPRPDPSPVHLVSVPGQTDYMLAIQELDALLRARQDRLDPQTVAVVRRNMAIIDEAIRAAQSALATDPANGDLNRAVSTVYKTKINLLRRAVELPART